MSDTDEPKAKSDETPSDQIAADEARAAASEQPGAPLEGANGGEQAEPAVPEPPPPPTLEQLLEAAQQDIKATREKMLRIAADYENYRKRTSREVDEARARGREGAVKDLLPVFDNLERATLSITDATDTARVTEGLLMVQKQFVDVLSRMGVERVPTVGLGFDPSLHESIQYASSHEHPAGTVVSELQAGYKHRGMLIRPALVVVSRGPEQPAPPDEPPADAPAEAAPDSPPDEQP